jgi:hypothetical protein
MVESSAREDNIEERLIYFSVTGTRTTPVRVLDWVPTDIALYVMPILI